jgi:hypothetical protein
MGFVIMTYLWLQYGEDAVEGIINMANQTFLSFYAFENAIEAYTGKDIQIVFNEAQSYFRDRWVNLERKYKPSPIEDVNKRSKYFSSYNVIERYKDSVIAYKTSLDEISQFVRISSNGSEKHLFYPTYFSDDSFDVSHESVVFADIIPAKRYGLQSRSVIKKYSLKTGKVKTLVKYGFNYLPRLKGKNLLYVSFDGHYYRIMLKDIKSKIKTLIYKTPYRLSTVAFHKKGIVFIESKNNVSYLKYWKNNEVDILNTYTGTTIWNLRSKNGRIFYLSNAEGVTHLYSFKNGTQLRHLNSKFGFLSFSLGKKNEVFISNYTANGAKIAKTKLKKLSVKQGHIKINPITKHIPKIVNKDYIERDMGTFENLFNFHSWNVFPDVVGNNYYFSITSKNILNTLSFQTGYTYNFLEQAGGLFGTLSFSSPFAIWDLGFQTIERGNYNETTNEIDGQWQERQVSFGPRISLDFSRHGHNHLLSFSYKAAVLEASKRDIPAVGELNDSTLLSHDFVLQYLYTKQMSSLDLQPDYGVELILDFKNGFEMDNSSNESSKHSAFGNLFFPSFLQTGLKLTGMYESRDLAGYNYASVIPFARGYGSVLSDNWTGGSAEFVFPISYKEIDLTTWLYFKRFKGALFYDRVINSSDQPLSSYGAELTAMTHLFRNYDLLIDIGLRATHLVELDSNEAEVFLDTVFSY